MQSSFSDKFARYSDRQLLDALSTIFQYTPDAAAELMAEAEMRGGVEKLTEQVQAEILAENEYNELVKGIDKDLRSGRTVDDITDELVAKGIFTPDIERLVDQREELLERERNALIETPTSAARILIGGVVASIIGGLYARICFINQEKIFFILAIGFLIQPYYTIGWISGGKRTILFYVTVLGSIVGSTIIGSLLFDLGIM